MGGDCRYEDRERRGKASKSLAQSTLAGTEPPSVEAGNLARTVVRVREQVMGTAGLMFTDVASSEVGRPGSGEVWDASAVGQTCSAGHCC